MKKTNTNEFRSQVQRYFADSVYDHEFAELGPAAAHIWERFDREYNFEANRKRWPALQRRVKEWLSGLPLSIDFSYADIIARAEAWHECKLTESQADMICERWFDFLAFQLLRMWRDHSVDVSHA